MKQKYADAAIKLMISAFGETDRPHSSGNDATALGKKNAAFVKAQGLDGVDVE